MNGTVTGRDHVDLATLSLELQKTENRFNLTKREVSGNKLVRKARLQATDGTKDGVLMGEVASNGIW